MEHFVAVLGHYVGRNICVFFGEVEVEVELAEFLYENFVVLLAAF